MAEINFNANISSIVKFEKTTGKSIMEAFSGDKMSIATIVELVKCMSDAKDDDIDAFVKENGFEALVNKITNALSESGFLPKEKAEVAEK